MENEPKQDGRSQRPRGRFRLSLKAIAKIFAVEGIELTPEAEAELERREREGLPPEERQGTLARKHGTTL